MPDASFAVIRAVGVETGGSNIQFGVSPDNGRMVIIEMNPRVSRSSALASKATGFPIAKIAAKLAVGYLLDELKNDITRETPAMGKPVALEASAELRLTRGFISMMTMRPLSGLTPNWMFEPPVSTPARMTRSSGRASSEIPCR